MLRQPDKATLCAFGVPDELFLSELNLSQLKDALTSDEEKRIDSSISERFYVYPRSQGQYSVLSVTDGKVTDTYNVNLNSYHACSCEDFMYNCSPNGISCKHIWRVRFLIKLNCLPPPEIEPYDWVVKELIHDITWLKNQDVSTDDEISRIHNLLNKITSLKKYNINYKYILRNRAQILMMSKAYTF